MVATLTQPIHRAEPRPRPTVAPPAPVVGEPVPPWIEVPLLGRDRPAERRSRAEWLLQETGSDRQALEEVQHHYLQRLHARSDDFAAAEALRTVEEAIALLPAPEPRWRGWRSRRS